MTGLELLKLVLNLLEVTACMAGFLNWRKIKATHWKYFPVYLAAIVLFEGAGRYLSDTKQYNLLVPMYNYFAIPMEILFFMWLFYKEFTNTRMRRLPLAAAAIYWVCWLADMFWIDKNPLWWLQSFSYTSGMLLLLVLALTFIFMLTTSNGILFIKSNMMFWVCLGLFVFYFCSLPFFGLGNYLLSHYKNLYYNYANAVYVLNCIMYSFFTISFIWGKPKLSFS
jgi:hypothetical protein